MAHPNDTHHLEALRVTQETRGAFFVTTDSVFGEVLALLSRNAAARESALRLFHDALSNENIDVVRQHAGLFNRAVERYAEQDDRTASLVDCISMEVMDDYGIQEVLTADRDFERAGYTRLMRNPSES